MFGEKSSALTLNDNVHSQHGFRTLREQRNSGGAMSQAEGEL